VATELTALSDQADDFGAKLTSVLPEKPESMAEYGAPTRRTESFGDDYFTAQALVP
jgi:hypothetical protein